MTFYLCTTARRKDGKRHIVDRYETEAEAVKASKGIDHHRYIITVCSGDWTYTNHIN